jgi:hypothetical protein
MVLGVIGLFAASSATAPAEALNSWPLEVDTVLTLPGKDGAPRGTCTLKKGTKVEFVSGSDPRSVTLSFAGVSFEMPRGEALREALATLYPEDAAPDKRAFDVEAWHVRESMPPGEAKWLPLPPSPDDRRKVHWDPAGYFAIPDDPVCGKTAEAAPPAGFAWDKSFINPGAFAFVRIPFMLQKKPGICTGAAGINAVRHLRPDHQLDAAGIFRLITDRPTSGSIEGLSNVMNQLGIVSERIRPTRSNLSSVLKRLKASFDRNTPVLAADVRHMVVLTGYNAAEKKLFVWNQWGNGKIVNGMPKGHYELAENDLPIEFNTLLFPRLLRYEPADNVKNAVVEITGEIDDLQCHPYFEPDFKFRGYEERIGPERIRGILQAGRTVLVPQGDNLLCILPGDTDQVTCITLPGGARNARTLDSLAAEILATNGGNFLSAKHAEKLLASTAP